MKIQCKNCGCSIKLNITVDVFKEKNKVAFKCPGCAHKAILHKKETLFENNLNLGNQTFIRNVKVPDLMLCEPASQQNFVLDQPFLEFGRVSSTSNSDLQLNTTDTSMSRKHCIFRKTNTGVTIEDTSRNGVIVNGRKLVKNEEVIFLNEGDVIQMGLHQFLIQKS